MSSLVEQVSDELRKRKWKITSAESCTGGMICAAITDLPGSSEIFDRGFITYSNQAKIDLLGVYRSILEAYGAVSEQTVSAMAEGALRQTPADVAVAVTGVAGPGGGSEEKPVGLVYIGISIRGRSSQAFRHIFSGDRKSIRQQSTDAAFMHILDLIGSSYA
jgi:nicotinamide-nucleotide amidase